MSVRLPNYPSNGQIFVDSNFIKWKWSRETEVWRRIGTAESIPIANATTIGLLSSRDKVLLDSTPAVGGSFGFIVAPQLILSSVTNPEGVVQGPITLHSESLDIKLVSDEGIELQATQGAACLECQSGTYTTVSTDLPGLQFSLSQKFLDTLCLEVFGPQGPRGKKGPTGATGIDGFSNGPVGEEGDPGREAISTHKFTGVKIIELDDIVDEAVVALELDGRTGVMSYASASINVPDNDEPADKFVAIPIKRTLYYPTLADVPYQYITLDDWKLTIPSGDPLPDNPEVLLLKMPKGVQVGDTTPTEAIRLSDYVGEIVTYYKTVLEQFQEEWFRQMKEFVESKDAAARQALASIAQQVAECEFQRPIQFCMGIQVDDCLDGEGGPYPSEKPDVPGPDDPGYEPPYPSGGIDPDDPDDPDNPYPPPKPPIDPEPPLPPLDPNQPCGDPGRVLIIMIVDESLDCYKLNLCAGLVDDPDAPTTADIIYDVDKNDWESYVRGLESSQFVMLGLLQPTPIGPEYTGDVTDLKYPERDLPRDSVSTTINYRLAPVGGLSRVTKRDVVDFVIDILGRSETPDYCGGGVLPENIIIQYHKTFIGTATAAADWTQIEAARVELDRLYPETCIVTKNGWPGTSLQPDEIELHNRWIWTSKALAENYLCAPCSKVPGGDEVHRLVLLNIMKEADPIYRSETEWDLDANWWQETIDGLAQGQSKVRVGVFSPTLQLHAQSGHNLLYPLARTPPPDSDRSEITINYVATNNPNYDKLEELWRLFGDVTDNGRFSPTTVWILCDNSDGYTYEQFHPHLVTFTSQLQQQYPDIRIQFGPTCVDNTEIDDIPNVPQPDPVELAAWFAYIGCLTAAQELRGRERQQAVLAYETAYAPIWSTFVGCRRVCSQTRSAAAAANNIQHAGGWITDAEWNTEKNRISQEYTACYRACRSPFSTSRRALQHTMSCRLYFLDSVQKLIDEKECYGDYLKAIGDGQIILYHIPLPPHDNFGVVCAGWPECGRYEIKDGVKTGPFGTCRHSATLPYYSSTGFQLT